jgi:hypothetical protein
MSAKSEGGRSLPKMPLLPVCARIDGKAFHSWTRGMERPFDERLHNLFVATTTFLVEETRCRQPNLLRWQDPQDGERAGVDDDGVLQREAARDHTGMAFARLSLEQIHAWCDLIITQQMIVSKPTGAMPRNIKARNSFVDVRFPTTLLVTNPLYTP